MNNSCSVAVIGGTPGGIATAVRAARAGCETTLITYNQHLGGMMAGGLSYTDTLTVKQRSPILAEFFDAVRSHYRSTYGVDSLQYEFSENGHIFEPHVAEEIFEDLIDEPALTVYRGFRPISADRTGETVNTLTLESFDRETTLDVSAEVFVEATYEGDVAATVGVPYRVGRESRDEYGEQFAGQLYTGIRGDQYYPREAVGDGDATAPPDRRGPLDVLPEKQRGSLDLVPHPAGLTEIYPGSTGVGDDAIQAYNYRLCLSRNPETRRLPEKPRDYDRSNYLDDLEAVKESDVRSHLLLRYLPNEKADMNSADLPGENHEYPEANWERREEIADRHRRHALGLLYFLQNDSAVPEDARKTAREWGLATDEFTDSENFPWQLYIREARRIEGRSTFTEQDARLAHGINRTPVNCGSIAIAEYPLDSHACHDTWQRGSQPEGFFYASQVTRPSQVPYDTLLPVGVDNLLAPVPLSATHVAYGTIRLEPTWMHIGEAAGVAAALAIETATQPANLNVGELQMALADSGIMLSFFNEFDMGTDEPWIPAIQFFGAKGFFAGYDARPNDPLDTRTFDVWLEQYSRLCDGSPIDPTCVARQLPDQDTSVEIVTATAFRERLAAEPINCELLGDGTDVVPRGTACQVLYESLKATRTEEM